MARILTDETSLGRRRGSLRQESRVLGRVYLWEFAAAGLLLAGGLILFLLHRQTAGLWAGGLLAIFGYGHFLKIRQNQQEAKSLEAGQQGENRAAKQLAEGLDQTHYLFNDILLRHGFRSAQIDHLVVGPRGIFVVETKNWRGSIRGQGEDTYWWQVKRPGEQPIRLKSPVLQAIRHASVLTHLLQGVGPAWPDVVPVVAFAFTSTNFEVAHSPIPVVHAPQLPAVISAHKPHRVYAEGEVDRVVQFLMKRL